MKMFWRQKPILLGDVESVGNWDYQLVDAPAQESPADGIAPNKVWAYILGPDEGGARLSWLVRCDPFRRAILQLGLVHRSSIRLLVRCNGKTIYSEILEPDQSTDAAGTTQLEVELGDHKNNRALCNLDLEVQHLETPSEILVLADGDHAPKVVMRPNARDFWIAALFFLAAWVAICSILIVAVIVSGAFQDPRLSTLIAIAAPLIGFYGIRDVSKFGPSNFIRRGFGISKTRLGFTGSVGLVVCAIALSTAAAFALDVSWKKFRYAEGISPFLEPSVQPRAEGLRDLLIAEPWRREAQVLFEQRAIEQRRLNQDDFRQFVRIITDDADLLRIIEATDGTPPYYMTDDPETSWDPVRWYASMLPEGDTEDDSSGTELAIALLDGRSDCGSQLHRKVLSLDLYVSYQVDGTLEVLETMIVDLADTLKNCGPETYPYEFSRQLALDTLAVYAVIDNFDRATEIWIDLLKIRSGGNRQDRYWRAPNKLVLFQLFRNLTEPLGTYDPNDPKNTLAERILARTMNDGTQFRDVFIDKVFSAYPKFEEQDEWENGTIVNVSTSDLRELLNKGWRF